MIGLATIGISYYLWFSPLFIFIGGITFISGVLFSIITFIRKEDDTIENHGCLVIFVIILLVVSCLFRNTNGYVSVFGGTRHVYPDCTHMEGPDVHEVSMVSTMIWGCFNMCSYCLSRREKNQREEMAERKKQEKINKLNFIDEHIEELQKVRQMIVSNKEVDIDNYYFRYEVEDVIRDEAIEDYYDSYEPRGWR